VKNISIRRCSGQDADLYQGVIEPEDGSWRLFLDKEGFPHLVIRTNVEDDDGKIVNGYLNLDAVLPEGTSIKDLVQVERMGNLGRGPTWFLPDGSEDSLPRFHRARFASFFRRALRSR
jgi:hypothetical protein